MLKTILNAKVLLAGIAASLITAQVSMAQSPEFEAPVRLQAAGEYIKTESPGYAAPCWADVNGDGKNDLIVGQFAGGKMMVYRNLGDGKFAKGEWLEAGGGIAEVPGVW